MTISVNPSITIAPPSSFLVDTQGYTQGQMLSDPVARQWLLSGYIASSVAQVMWGGMGIEELVNTPPGLGIGNAIEIAASEAALTGFSVFNRAYSMIVTPGNTVQTASAGMSIAYYRLGSNARIPVLCTAALITAVEGNPTNTQVAWDFTNQQLIPYASGTALPVKVVDVNTNSKVVSYSGGVASWATGSVAIIQI